MASETTSPMRVIVSIPVEKVAVLGGYSFRHERIELTPLRVIRSPARHDKDCHPWKVTGWYYDVDVLHPRLCPEVPRIGFDGTYRAGVSRALNRHWKPPVFPDGKNWVAVGESQP